MNTVCLSLTTDDGKFTEEQIALFQQVSDAMSEAMNTETDEVAKVYPDLQSGAVADIVYLRTRSRWTPELEDRLIKEHRDGKDVMICDWPGHSDGNYNPYTGKPLTALE